jgi:hypothetical protein
MVSPMPAMRVVARRHPALNYYALVFAISWGGILELGWTGFAVPTA